MIDGFTYKWWKPGKKWARKSRKTGRKNHIKFQVRGKQMGFRAKAEEGRASPWNWLQSAQSRRGTDSFRLQPGQWETSLIDLKAMYSEWWSRVWCGNFLKSHNHAIDELLFSYFANVAIRSLIFKICNSHGYHWRYKTIAILIPGPILVRI